MIGIYGDHRYANEALSLFEEMPNERVHPDAITFCAVLSACSHGGLVDKSLDIIHSMHSHFGILPTSIHHNCIIDNLGRAGRLEEAESYLLANESHSNYVSWVTLEGACRIHGDLARGERAERRARALAPRQAASRVLLANLYAAAGQWEAKDRVREQMKKEGIRKIPGISNIELKGKVFEFFVGDRRHPQSDAILAYLSKLWAEMKEAGFCPKTETVMHNMTEDEKECHLCHHSEKIALAFGLMNTAPGTPLIISKNLRVCPDCHEATKFIARLTGRRISARDASSWHHFDPVTGKCACGDNW